MQFTLKQARLHSDKTQAEMAKLLGICRNKYLNIEKYPDTATIAEAKKISKITGIPLENLFLARTLLKVELRAKTKGRRDM